MKRNNVVVKKSFKFSIKVVKFADQLNKNKDYSIANQLLRCGTSIGANVEKAMGAQSRKDFLSKISIAYKEARETYYWLRLISETRSFNLSDLTEKAEKLIKILASIKKTTERSLRNNY